MNFKLTFLLLLTVLSSMLFSACAGVKGKLAESEEVVIDGSSLPANQEVVITDADLQDKDKQISNVRENTQVAKRVLADKSEINTLFDGLGNKTETRFFPGHPRLRLVILRTSVDGKQEVTVYGYGETKIVEGLGVNALTASGDEIAKAAQLPVIPSFSATRNYMKGNKTEPALQPLPSSAFQSPLSQITQPAEIVRSETNGSDENSSIQPNPEEEKD